MNNIERSIIQEKYAFYKWTNGDKEEAKNKCIKLLSEEIYKSGWGLNNKNQINMNGEKVEMIENVDMLRAFLLDVVHRIVELGVKPMKEMISNYLKGEDSERDEEMKLLLESLHDREERIYNQYGIVRCTQGKIE